MRYIGAFFIAMLISSATYAQTAFAAKKIPTTKTPPGLKYQGKPLEVWQWKDNQGDNLLLLTKTPEHVMAGVQDEDMRAAELYAYLYIKSDSGYKVSWKLADLVNECPFDITLSYFKNNVSITDLDKDGIAEVTLVYRLSCRSDVSPDNMKLIMREGQVKYALRGLTCDPANGVSKKPCVVADSLDLSMMPPAKDEWDEMARAFGRYENENDFKGGPDGFLAFARQQWLRFVNKSFE